MKRSLVLASIAIVIVAAVMLQCSKGDKGTTPTQSTVDMTGTLSFPGLSAGELNAIKVGFGSNESSVDTSGTFAIKGNGHVVGVALAYDDQEVPLLMGVCPDPSSGTHLDLDVHSTAVALAFLNPFICIASPAHAEAVTQRIEQLPELIDLENLLYQKLSANPAALGAEDAELDSSLSRLVLAYFNSYPDEVAKRVAAVSGVSLAGSKTTAGGPEIDPNYTQSGLRLTWDGGKTYKISNSYGRWCYACTPDDTFFVFPNGDLLDWIKKDTPFPASERKFDMDVVAGEDTSWVELYGYGFTSYYYNAWDSLSHTEKNYAHAGGITTVTMELFTQVVSALCNTPRVFGNEKIAKLWSSTGWDFIVNNSRIVQRLEEYIKADNPIGASWWLTKQIMSQAVTSAAYREFLAQTVGLSLTDGMVVKLGAWLNVPAKAVIATNNLTSVFKAVLALNNAQFATCFKVWREFEDFGSISGQVAAKNSGNGISGATVTLAGDENNPLNPAHQVATDAQGHFRFDNIGVGPKTLTASKSGYLDNSVTATVVKDQTVTANIQLEVPTGGMTGKVLSEILQQNGVSPADFPGTVEIEARDVSGQRQPVSVYCYDGSYTLNLMTGTWWVVASHDDYKPDSFSVTVLSGGGFAAPRDLVLKPDQSMTGHVYLNTDNQGSYEISFDLNLSQLGLSKPKPYTNGCYWGGQPRPVMNAVASRPGSNSDYDAVELDFDTTMITSYGDYRVGGTDYFGCSGHNTPAAASFITTRWHCSYLGTYLYPITYAIQDDPDSYGCNCGVSLTQSVTITQWGTQLGDIVAGTCVLQLAGSNTCECGGNDTNGDGHIDKWDVSCNQARVEIEFRLLVGTDYLSTFSPNGSPTNSNPLSTRRESEKR